MTTDTKTRARNLVLGALVADAAAMGLHWIYDQDHIRKVAPETPEFTTPDPAHFEGVPAFFAHSGRKSGEQSQYGEQAIVMARALATNHGQFDAALYALEFRSHFGYGGKYVGYIDHATRDTLDNFRRAQDALILDAKKIPFDGDPRYAVAMMNKANVAITQNKGDAVRTAFEKAVRIMDDSDAAVAYGFKVLDLVLETPPASGAIDMQLPAIAKLPALVAVQTLAGTDEKTATQSVTSAVRMTSDHPLSVEYGNVCAKMMQTAIEGAGIADIIAAGRAVADPEIDALISSALSMTEHSNLEATKHFGMACDLPNGVPSIVHNLATAPDYKTAIRNNIYAGGDSCGRAILLGAIAGAVYGVPQEWVAKLTMRSDMNGLLSDLIG